MSKRFILLLSLVLLLPLGCGGNSGGAAGTARVTGKVRHDGYLLPFGAVQFYGDQAVYNAVIGPDGSYSFPSLPEGTFSICVRTKGDLFADSRQIEIMKKFQEEMKSKGDKFPGDKVPDPKQIMIEMSKGKTGMRDGKPGFKGPLGRIRKGDPAAALFPVIDGQPVQAFLNLPDNLKQEIWQLHDKYGEFKDAKLTYTVVPGSQTFDIILK